MASDWVVDLGPGEWRVQRRLTGEMTQTHVWRPHWSALLPGDAVMARLVNRNGLVDIDGEAALLSPLPRGATLGSRQLVQVVRARVPEPGRWKPARVKPYGGTLEPLAPLQDRWLRLTGAADGAPGRIEPDLSQALTFGSGMLTLERTRLGVVADVDAAGEVDAVNARAAQLFAERLCALDLGGVALIEFAGLPDKARRARLAQGFDAAAAADPRPFERTGINGYGLMQVVRPRLMPSLLDVWLGTGRDESAETHAIALMRQVAASRGHGDRRIVASPDVVAAFSPFAADLQALARGIGAPVRVEADPGITSAGHVHVAHP